MKRLSYPREDKRRVRRAARQAGLITTRNGYVTVNHDTAEWRVGNFQTGQTWVLRGFTFHPIEVQS